MARTFTGLKLQGAIGKFGAVELSDVSAFVELPDGRVLSGSESGLMLMWDAHLIQYQVARLDGRPCHDGAIQSIALCGSSSIVTTGDDGWVRVWAYGALEFAEVTEDDPFIRLQPLQEVRLGRDVRCLTLLDGEPGEWLIQDSTGAIHSHDTATHATRQLLATHSGPIRTVITSPHSHLAVTAGSDRSLRCWDLFHGTSLYSRTFSSAVTALHWAPATVDAGQATVYAGFEDGTVRAIHRYLEAFVTVLSIKPHRSPVSHVSVSPTGAVLVTASTSGELFFFALVPGAKGVGAKAVGCVKLGQEVRSVSWNVMSTRLLMAVGGSVVELDVPEIDGTEGDERDSYVLTVARREWRPELRSSASTEDASAKDDRPSDDDKRRKEREVDMTDDEVDRERVRRDKRDERRRRRAAQRKEEDERPYDVSTVLYAPHSNTTFFFTLAPPQGAGSGYPAGKVETLYLGSFDSPVPLKAISLGPLFGAVSSLSYSPSSSFVMLGSTSGVVQVRSTLEPLYFFQVHEHDASALVHGAAMTMDERMMVTVGSDGGMFAYVVDGLGALSTVDRGVEAVVNMERARRVEERRERLRKRAEDDERRRKERRERQLLNKAAAAASKDDRPRSPAVVSDSESPDEAEDDEEDLSHLCTTIDAAPIVITSSTPADSSDVLLPSPAADPLPTSIAAVEVTDALTASSYSIEEAKAKAEEDDRQRDLARQQLSIEEEMMECRQQYTALMAQREQWEQRVKDTHLPQLSASADPAVTAALAEAALPLAMFDLDPDLPSHVASLTDSKVAALQASLAYDIELHQRQLAKLKAAFLDPVEAESFVVRAFDLGDIAPQDDAAVEEVWSYRLARMPQWLQTEVAAVHARMEEEEARNRRAEDESRRWAEAEQKEAEDALSASSLAPSHPSTSPSHPTPSQPSSLDSRYHQRLLRQRQIDQLLLLRPPLNQPTPAHVAALSEAEATIGDFKLKSSADYIVPEERKVNVERVRRRMVLLVDSVHAMKAAFNARMDELRRMKERIRRAVSDDRRAIDGIVAELRSAGDALDGLGLSATLIAHLDHVTGHGGREEWPERRAAFTEAELRDFVQRKHREQAGRRPATLDGDEEPSPRATPSGLLGLPSEAEQKTQMSLPRSSRGATAHPSSAYDMLDRTRGLLHRRQLRASLVSLTRRLYGTLLDFNAAVVSQKRAKLRLDDDVLNAELRLLTHCDELSVLKDFEEREKSLEEKGKKMKDGKTALIGEMGEVERGLNNKMKDMAAGVEKEKSLMAEFVTAVGGEKNEFYSILLKVYRRKVKRRKTSNKPSKLEKKDKEENKSNDPLSSLAQSNLNPSDPSDAASDDSASDDDSDAESVTSTHSSAGHSDSDDEDDESCPPHCPPIAYERTLALRERRLDNEDSMDGLQKACTELAKVYERLQGKVKVLDKEERSLDREMQNFQSDKQKTLNTIDVHLPMQLSQVLHFATSTRNNAKFALPSSLGDSLLFTRPNAARLQRRTFELESERLDIEGSFAALKRSSASVQKEMDVWSRRIDEEKRRCESVQMLKFGRLVDLHFILDDDGGRQRDEDEKRRQLADMEQANRQVVQKWDDDLAAAKVHYQEQLQLNTTLLERVAALTEQQYALEGRLNGGVADVGLAEGGEEGEERREKEELVRLVETQEREIEALKAEMGVLRRKGGHVYTAE